MPTQDNAPAESLEDRVLAALNEDVSTKSTDEEGTKAEADKAVDDAEDETTSEEESQDEEDSDESSELDAEDDDEAADGDAAKNQNRVGYQLRQLRQKDEFVQKSRETLNNWVNSADDNQEARLRRMEADQYLADVERSRAQLVTDGDRIIQEIPLFNPQSDDFDKAVYDRALQRYSRDQLITENVDGVAQIVGYKQPLLDYMKEEADAYYAGVESAKKRNAKSAEADKTSKEVDKTSQKKKQAKMDDAGEVTTGSRSPESSKSESNPVDDAFLAGFDSVK